MDDNQIDFDGIANETEYIGIEKNQINDLNNLIAYNKSAVNSWSRANSSNPYNIRYTDNSSYWYNKMEKIIKKYSAFYDSFTFDYGVGLYPTYQIIINGKEYTEYNPTNFFKRINDFWKCNQ